MRYYLIVGEASGDLHASHLIEELRRQDSEAEFRFIGGDMMKNASAEKGSMLKHYKDLAYMGFIPVLMHLPTILSNMRICKRDITEWNPDALILVDYPGFNLKIAKFIKSHTNIPIFYYISPKIWAWKEFRIKNIKRDIYKLLSILPFEVAFYEGKHNYKIDYVGNPTVNEIEEFKKKEGEFVKEDAKKIALLAGSRKQEIKDNLPMMLEAAESFPDYKFTIAGAPGIEKEFYDKFLKNKEQNIEIVFGQTYKVLHESVAALVTSGTATLETALLDVPQVVCYYTPVGKFISWLRKKVLKVKYISLVNLIVNQELVTELVADTMTIENIRKELRKILPGSEARQRMLDGYVDMRTELGTQNASETAASIIIDSVKNAKKS